ncbi:serine/threonine-protein phosphatase [Iamia majanohamensis]|uniref:Serine/threonine-protein phosphatase n=1 Tax=Iamia majanohamensis TaxID=467976 RepID=A0AAF0BWN8_9ACTN|nr:PP2C family serine/threonine-protein phosphatase [Iamia majanohamensis]WCO68020.1 serine/threonine-protein phosphatase [Iamia majanohamensis]
MIPITTPTPSGKAGGTPPAATANDLVNGFWTANTAILDRALAEPSLHSMGSTLVAIEMLTSENTIAVVSVGDSRAYRLRDGDLWRITTDHTWEAALLSAGIEPAIGRRSRHILTRCLGSTAAIDVDAWILDLRPGDRFLLCSDGIHGVLDDTTIGTLLAGPDDGRTAQRVVDTAIDAHSTDDVTALVADVVRARELATRLRRIDSARRHPSRRAARISRDPGVPAPRPIAS